MFVDDRRPAGIAVGQADLGERRVSVNEDASGDLGELGSPARTTDVDQHGGGLEHCRGLVVGHPATAGGQRGIAVPPAHAGKLPLGVARSVARVVGHPSGCDVVTRGLRSGRLHEHRFETEIRQAAQPVQKHPGHATDGIPDEVANDDGDRLAPGRPPLAHSPSSSALQTSAASKCSSAILRAARACLSGSAAMSRSARAASSAVR